MKKMMGIALLNLVAMNCFCQYTVTKVTGIVKNRNTNEILKTGSRFNDTTALAFASPNYMVRAIATGKGVVVISSNATRGPKKDIAGDIFKYMFNVRSREGYLSGRGATTPVLPDALQADTAINAQCLVEKESHYLFDRTVYQVANGDAFFIQVSLPGREPVIHPLAAHSDTLVLHASDFSGVNKKDGQNGIFTLGFYHKGDHTSESLLVIDPQIDLSGNMKTIIRAMVQESKEKDKAILRQICYREVYETLGRPSDLDFEDLFNKLTIGK